MCAPAFANDPMEAQAKRLCSRCAGLVAARVSKGRAFQIVVAQHLRQHLCEVVKSCHDPPRALSTKLPAQDLEIPAGNRGAQFSAP